MKSFFCLCLKIFVQLLMHADPKGQKRIIVLTIVSLLPFCRAKQKGALGNQKQSWLKQSCAFNPLGQHAWLKQLCAFNPLGQHACFF